MDYRRQYFSITPIRPIVITELYTIHYFENFKNYYFPGESHDFWELLYVDRGEIIVETNRLEKPVRMDRGDLILHRPNEFHSFYANDIVPHNLVIVSFDCRSPAMDFFQRHPFFHTCSSMRARISKLLEEARICFSVPLEDPNLSKLERSSAAPFGSEQMIVNTLELLLISLCRKEGVRSDEEAERRTRARAANNNYVQRAISYMKENLTVRICLNDICIHSAVGRAQMQRIFREQTGMSVMHYLSKLRIEEAKFLIRSRNLNFTEISKRLCYSSVHHFSKQFHRTVGMSPSDYVASIQALTEADPT